MKNILLLLLLNWGAFAQTAKTTGAWLPVDMKWEHAPPEVNRKLETGSTTVLYFGEHGLFAVLRCVVNREAGRYTTLSQGDGQVISLGEWNGHFPGRAKYRLVSRTVPAGGEKLPGPWHEEELVFTQRGYVLFRGQRYRHVDELGQSVKEILPSSLPDSNQ